MFRFRRCLSRTLFGFALSLLVLAMGLPVSAAPVPIKIGIGGPPDFIITRALREVFKPYVEEHTKGKYRVDIYDSYKFGTWDVEFQAVQYGTLHMMQDSTSNLSSIVPELAVLDLPYIAPDPSRYDTLLDSQPVIDLFTKFHKFDVTCVARLHSGARQIFSRKDVKTLADFKNFKMRSTASKIHNALLKAEGMNPTPVPFAETYTALQQGVVDGVDVDVPQGVLLNFPTVASVLFLNAHTMLGQPIIANKTWWETGLKGDDKRVFEEAMAELIRYVRANALEDERRNIEKMRAMGKTVIVPDEAELQLWREATSGVHKQFSQTLPENLVQRIRAAAQ